MSFPLPVPAEVTDFLRSNGSFFILGHVEPDGDCIGSQLALGSALTRLGASVSLLNSGPFERQEIVDYKDSFVTHADSLPKVEAAIVVDCSSSDRIGRFFFDIVDEYPTLVIDHHIGGSPFGNVRFVRPEIPATTILISSIIAALGLEISGDEAQALFLGLATDTGFFRFVEGGNAVAFEAAARLVAAGASPRETDETIAYRRSFESRILISRMIQRAERLQDGDFVLTYQTNQDDLELGARRDSDALYRLLLAVEGVRAIVVVKEKNNGCAVSLRSNDSFDVAAIAGEFGGGGHQKAAGAFVAGPLIDVLASFRRRLMCNAV